MKNLLSITSLAAALTLLAGTTTGALAASCGHQHDVVGTAVEAGDFKTLTAALEAAGLAQALKAEGPFTVFAPTDAAFAKLPEGTVESLLQPENKAVLTAILTYHVVPGSFGADQVTKLSGAETLNGQRVDFTSSGKGVTVDGAKVIKADIETTNGVIHVIDSVILPADKNLAEVADEAGTFTTLLAAAKAAGLADALMGDGPYTVFAPTDEAFARLPDGTVESLLKKENQAKLQSVLKYHIAKGRVYSDQVVIKDEIETLAGQSIQVKRSSESVKLNSAGLVALDIDASNGVIHVIDQVLIPEAKQSSREAAMGAIKMAIHHGAPIYNAGDAAGCAALYHMTAVSLLEAHADLPPHSRQALERALIEMRSAHSDDEKAWVMRFGLDRAYRAMMLASAEG
jgi:uncharacterized surface protein with fasciclin (FAS1) repeats